MRPVKGLHVIARAYPYVTCFFNFEGRTPAGRGFFPYCEGEELNREPKTRPVPPPGGGIRPVDDAFLPTNELPVVIQLRRTLPGLGSDCCKEKGRLVGSRIRRALGNRVAEMLGQAPEGRLVHAELDARPGFKEARQRCTE